MMEGERIMTVSKDEVPVDIGILKASGIVDRPIVEKNKVTVKLGYGGMAKAYARVQHERQDFVHKGQGKAHYLKDPTNAAKKGFGVRISRELERRLV